MLKNCIYFICLIWLFLISSCIDDGKLSKNISETTPHLRQENIQNLERKVTDEKLTYDLTPIQYQNTTTYKQCIGELIDGHIEALQPEEQELKISTHPDTPEKNYFSSNPDLRKTAWMLRLILDNDIFSNTDYYYTNGFRVELVVPGLNKSPVNKIFPASKNIDIEFCGFSITQNIYTPTNPDTRDVLLGDRPFAAYLAIGQFREVYNLSKTIYFKSELNLGVLGPSSLGQQVQSSIHEIEPIGWQNQISNDVVIDYRIQFKKGIYNNSLFDFNINANGNLGTLYNKVGGGFDLRFGHFTPFYSGPLSIFEFENPGGHLQYWIFLKANGNIVAYDATLQGGMFNKENPYIIMANDINQFVVNASIGFAIYYNNIGIEYEHFYLSPEFTEARHFGWGSITATIAF